MLMIFIPRSRSRKMSSKGLIGLAIVSLLICSLAGCGGKKQAQEERAAKLQELYEALVAVQAATQVGVTYMAYGPLLNKAAAAIAVYEAEDDNAREVASELADALDEYKFAGEAWSIKIQDSGDAWHAFLSAHPDLPHKYDSIVTSSDLDNAIQYFWRRADTHMEAARGGLAAYKEE